VTSMMMVITIMGTMVIMMVRIVGKRTAPLF
jgi:hypothetical protein